MDPVHLASHIERWAAPQARRFRCYDIKWSATFPCQGTPRVRWGVRAVLLAALTLISREPS
jgi:hypothetical protein